MSIQRSVISVKTKGRGFYDITQDVGRTIQSSGLETGLCNLFIQHTSASITLCENADPSVKEDLERFMQKIAPDGDSAYLHSAEGDDDMPAHIRTVLTQSSLMIPVESKSLLLGTWQSVYLWEHRKGHFTRQVVVTLVGESL